MQSSAILLLLHVTLLQASLHFAVDIVDCPFAIAASQLSGTLSQFSRHNLAIFLSLQEVALQSLEHIFSGHPVDEYACNEDAVQNSVNANANRLSVKYLSFMVLSSPVI